MNAIAEDIKDLLVDESVGVFASTSDWGIYIEREPKTPDNCITIYDAAGTTPSRASDRTVKRMIYSRVEIRVRGKTYNTAWDKLTDIIDILEHKTSFTKNGTFYSGIFQEGEPFFFTDEEPGPVQGGSERYIWTVVFRCIRRNTAWTPPSGCIGWWSATLSGATPEGGILVDRSINSNDLTLYEDCYVVSSILFDGNNDYARFETVTPFLSKSTGTICFWMKNLDRQATITFLNICKASGGAGGLARQSFSVNFYYGGDVSNRGKIYVTKVKDGTSYIAYGSTLINSSGWYHIIISCPGASDIIKIYINNAEVSSYVTGGSGHPTGFTDGVQGIDRMEIGRFSDAGLTGQALQGEMDELMFFNRALSAAERLSVYVDGYPK